MKLSIILYPIPSTEDQKQTIDSLKELKALVYDEIEVPELEGDFNIIIRKTLLKLDYILADELIKSDAKNLEHFLDLKKEIIKYLTRDYQEDHSYGSILTFGHYMNYILFVVISFEHIIKQKTT